MPVDWVTGYSPLAGVRLYAVSPPCVTPDASLPSTIVGRETAAGGRRRRRIGARARGPRSGRGPARRGSSRGGVRVSGRLRVGVRRGRSAATGQDDDRLTGGDRLA